MKRRALSAAVALLLVAQAFFAQSKPDALKEYRAGRYEEARRICMAELAANASNIESYVVLAWSLLALERHADAELYGKKGLAYRKDPRLLEATGEASYYLGKNDAALEYLRAYVVALPEGDRIDRAYYYLGEVYVRKGKYSHADISFTVSATFSPRNARYWARAGYAREQVGDLRFALAAYQSALAIDPTQQDASLGRDRVLARLSG
jgi:tetratricopeptide (TPR) repeat protein